MIRISTLYFNISCIVPIFVYFEKNQYFYSAKNLLASPRDSYNMNSVSINKDRIKYLLSLHKMTMEEFLFAVSKGLKKPLCWEDIYCDSLPLNTLKRVDAVFNKGLFYYADPETPKINKSASVFFRKENFGAELNLGSRQRVREFEDLKTRLNTISKLSDITLRRKLPICNEFSNPREVAFAVREKVLPEFSNNKREFLKNFINKLGEQNVIVFEFVDVSNKKDKANVDGFYLCPNAIVLKRRQDSFSREIFTLAHELGHYLLNQEEIEEVDVVAFSRQDAPLSKIENWCNFFAFYLLLGNKNSTILDRIDQFDKSNDYGHEIVAQISKMTNLSRLAIFTNLLLQHKLSYDSYQNIKDEIMEELRQKDVQKALQKEIDKLNGIESKGRNPQPIQANIVKDIFSVALSSGVIGEQEFCKAMKIKPSEINSFIYL